MGVLRYVKTNGVGPVANYDLVVFNWSEGRFWEKFYRKSGIRWIRTRWQSTLLEQGLFSRFMELVDDVFLAELFAGSRILFLDVGTRKKSWGLSRVQWFGLPMVVAGYTYFRGDGWRECVDVVGGSGLLDVVGRGVGNGLVKDACRKGSEAMADEKIKARWRYWARALGGVSRRPEIVTVVYRR